MVVRFACRWCAINKSLLPVHIEVNKAFPPSAEVRVAEAGLRALIQQDQAGVARFEKQYASRLMRILAHGAVAYNFNEDV